MFGFKSPEFRDEWDEWRETYNVKEVEDGDIIYSTDNGSILEIFGKGVLRCKRVGHIVFEGRAAAADFWLIQIRAESGLGTRNLLVISDNDAGGADVVEGIVTVPSALKIVQKMPGVEIISPSVRKTVENKETMSDPIEKAVDQLLEVNPSFTSPSSIGPDNSKKFFFFDGYSTRGDVEVRRGRVSADSLLKAAFAVRRICQDRTLTPDHNYAQQVINDAGGEENIKRGVSIDSSPYNVTHYDDDSVVVDDNEFVTIVATTKEKRENLLYEVWPGYGEEEEF